MQSCYDKVRIHPIKQSLTAKGGQFNATLCDVEEETLGAKHPYCRLLKALNNDITNTSLPSGKHCRG